LNCINFDHIKSDRINFDRIKIELYKNWPYKNRPYKKYNWSSSATSCYATQWEKIHKFSCQLCAMMLNAESQLRAMRHSAELFIFANFSVNSQPYAKWFNPLISDRSMINLWEKNWEEQISWDCLFNVFYYECAVINSPENSTWIRGKNFMYVNIYVNLLMIKLIR
jgi:hypothetical protein